MCFNLAKFCNAIEKKTFFCDLADFFAMSSEVPQFSDVTRFELRLIPGGVIPSAQRKWSKQKVSPISRARRFRQMWAKTSSNLSEKAIAFPVFVKKRVIVEAARSLRVTSE